MILAKSLNRGGEGVIETVGADTCSVASRHTARDNNPLEQVTHPIAQLFAQDILFKMEPDLWDLARIIGKYFLITI